jgi:TolB protein
MWGKVQWIVVVSLCLLGILNVTAQTEGPLADEIAALDYSPDGQFLAQAGGAFGCLSPEVELTLEKRSVYAIEIFDAETLTSVTSLIGHLCRVNAVEWSPNGQHLISSGMDGLAQIWEVSTRDDISRISVAFGNAIHGGTWHPTGAYVADFFDNAAGARIWDPSDGTLIASLAPSVSIARTMDIAWSPDGAWLAQSDSAGYVHIWDVSAVVSGVVTEPMASYPNLDATTVAWSPDSSQLALGGNEIRIIEPATGQITQTLSGHDRIILSMEWNPINNSVASASVDGIVKVWDTQSATEITTYDYGTTAFAVAWTPDGDQLVYGGAAQSTGAATVSVVTVASLSFVLVDSTTNQGIQPLVESDTIDLGQIGTDVIIQAVTVPDVVSRVQFDLNGVVESDNVQPYQLTTNLTPGNYTLTGIPFFDVNSVEQSGVPLTINFTIVDSGSTGGGPNQILFSSVTNTFTAATNIFVINPDGTGQTQLTTGNGIRNFPAWSPDGTQILYSSNQDGDDEIFVMNADGSNPVQLTANTALDRFPVWSPDGMQIAFASRRDGNWEIYVMNADGTNPVNLTNNASDDFNVSWSPDGSQIAFASLRDASTSTDTEIYVMNADGANVQRLTNSPSIDETPNWSPDGSQIAFTSNRNASNIDIYVMNADGTNVQRLTSYSGTDEFPNWSPDGTQIAFDSNRSSFFNLYFDIHRMNADGTNVQRISTRSAFDRFAAWGYP